MTGRNNPLSSLTQHDAKVLKNLVTSTAITVFLTIIINSSKMSKYTKKKLRNVLIIAIFLVILQENNYRL